MIFVWKGDEIDVISSVQRVKVILDLKDMDKTGRKTYYRRALMYVYYVYDKNSPYAGQYETTRKKKFSVEILKKDEDYWKKMEEHKEVKAFVEWFMDNALTVEERMVIDVERDIEKYVEHLNSIPYKKSNGEENIDVKLKAIKGAKDLFQLMKELRAMSQSKKAKENKKKVRTRLFEE